MPAWNRLCESLSGSKKGIASKPKPVDENVQNKKGARIEIQPRLIQYSMKNHLYRAVIKALGCKTEGTFFFLSAIDEEVEKKHNI